MKNSFPTFIMAVLAMLVFAISADACEKCKCGHMVLSFSMAASEEAPSHVAVTPADRNGEGWWKNRYAEKVAQAEKGDVDILFLGDSITHGDQKFVQTINPTSFHDANDEVIQYSRAFKATDDTQTIGFEGGRINATWSGSKNDATVLLDNVQVELKKLHFTKVFGDNFSVINNSNTVSPTANDAADRFSGLLGGSIGYIEKGGANFTANGGDNLQQVGHDSARKYIAGFNNDALMLATRYNPGQPYAGVTLNHNFIDEFDASEGAMYRLEFSVAPLLAYGITNGATLNTPGTFDSWAAVIFGAQETPTNVSNSSGVGILFRQNGGVQIFDKGTKIYSADPGTVDTSDGWLDVAIEYWVSDFDGSSVGVDLYVDDVLLHSFGTLTGIEENYVSFMSYMSNTVSPSGNFHYSYFDDIAVYSTAYGLPEGAVPEPATWLMMVLGLAGLAIHRFRRQ